MYDRCERCQQRKSIELVRYKNQYGVECLDFLCDDCQRKFSIISRKTTGNDVCEILKNHSDEFHDDPEHLSTEFMQCLIGESAMGCESDE